MQREIREAILEEARKHMIANLLAHDPFTLAAEAGAISFDDVYYYSLINAAGSFAYREKAERGKLYEDMETEDNSVLNYGGVELRIVADGPEVEGRAIHFVSEIMKISEEAAEKRYYDIVGKWTNWHNDNIGKKRGNKHGKNN